MEKRVEIRKVVEKNIIEVAFSKEKLLKVLLVGFFLGVEGI